MLWDICRFSTNTPTDHPRRTLPSSLPAPSTLGSHATHGRNLSSVFTRRFTPPQSVHPIVTLQLQGLFCPAAIDVETLRYGIVDEQGIISSAHLSFSVRSFAHRHYSPHRSHLTRDSRVESVSASIDTEGVGVSAHRQTLAHFPFFSTQKS